MIRADDLKNLVLKQPFIYTLLVNRLAYKQQGFTSTPRKHVAPASFMVIFRVID